MKNFEKYATIDKRLNAFARFCSRGCGRCKLQPYSTKLWGCGFAWLDLEADVPLPCPFCGETTDTNIGQLGREVKHWVDCLNPECQYRSANFTSKEDAIDAHNRVCKAVSTFNKEAPNE